MASTALNSRVVEAMVTSCPETTTASPVGGQNATAPYLAQYTAALEDFASRGSDLMAAAATSSGRASSPSGGELTPEDEEGSYDDNSSGCPSKSSISSLLDSTKKRRKQSKPNKIGTPDCSGEESEKESSAEIRDSSQLQFSDPLSKNQENHLTLQDTFEAERPGDANKSEFVCPHCQFKVFALEELHEHVIKEHLDRTLMNEELLLRHTQIARQRFQQQHQLQYQQRFFAETMRQQEEKTRRKLEEMQAEHQRSIQQSGTRSVERLLSNHGEQTHEQMQFNSLFTEREEGETGPLNLSSPRWESKSNSDQQRSPVTPLPPSIPMPPSFVDPRFGLPNFFPFAPPPILFPFLHQSDRENMVNSNGQSNSMNSSQSKIFNVEAFCDLCNKEFCNKYFLKTHKANKHGIYTDEPSCSPKPPTSLTPIGPTPPLPQNPPLIANIIHPPLPPTSINGSPYSGAFFTTNLGNIPAALRPPPPAPAHNHSKTTSSSVKGESSMSKTGVINLDAYCELCQKEFCNKYFLKRHKAKIHGISIEVTIKSPKTNPAIDRPEGWCDACRRDIGSRSTLNAHKLHAHGPHIVNNLGATEQSNKQPIDFRTFAQLPVKLGNVDRDIKGNFSPWDLLKDRENQTWNKLNGFGDVNQQKNVINLNETTRNDRNTNTDFERNSKLFLAEEGAGSSSQKSPFFSTEDDIIASNLRNIQHMKLCQINGISDSASQQKIKEEETISGKEPANEENDEMEVDQEPQMPILKPQITEPPPETLLMPADSIEPTETPPPLLKEQTIPQGRTDEEDNGERRFSASDAPRTPGGGSNSADDNSREAGIIARVGQPAIVQAPPGTKFTPEQLRQLGVINPDAFCELCCKEFCNKYFLRTHRIKKHNIYTPEFSDRSKQHFKDIPQVNLNRIFEKNAFEFRPQNLSEAEPDLECDLCRRTFPNPYVLHMHKFYYHGPAQDSLAGDKLALPEHILPQEQLRQLALQAHQHRLHDPNRLFLKSPQEHLTSAISQQINGQTDQREENKFNMGKQGCDDENQTFSSESGGVQTANGVLGNQSERCDHVKPEQNEGDEKEEQFYALNRSRSGTPVLPEHSNSSAGTNAVETDTSQELRKLQSMILELNRQGEDQLQCKICQKQIGSKYFLRAHMMAEHGIILKDEHLVSESAQTPKTPNEISCRINSPLNSLNALTSDYQTYCEICKKDLYSKYFLQQHMLSTHGIFTQHHGPTSFLDRIRAEVEGREERKPQSVSRSFCEICNKELCNKYFMKTHMLKMHGINIENGSSGGVTCDLCNKELCSKYFLKVHRFNTHGLLEDFRDGKDLKELAVKERKEGDGGSEDPIAPEICSFCQRKFKNLRWLKTHLNQDHGEEGKAKWREIGLSLPQDESLICSMSEKSPSSQIDPEHAQTALQLFQQHNPLKLNNEFGDTPYKTFQCSTCSFECRSPTIFAAHERSHSPEIQENSSSLPSAGISCNLCSHVLPSLESYQQHLFAHQLQGLFEPFLNKDFESKSFLKPSNRMYNLTKTRKPKKRFRCRRCNLSFQNRSSCLVHSFRRHSGHSLSTAKPIFRGALWGRKFYKCRHCGITKRRLSDLISHLNCHCINVKAQNKERDGNLWLNEVLKGMNPLVVTAEPADERAASQHYIMQSFLMSEDKHESKQHDDTETVEFVPSLVQLPVARRLLHPLTVSFTLTPA